MSNSNVHFFPAIIRRPRGISQHFGKTYGILTVLCEAENPLPAADRRPHVACSCACGRYTERIPKVIRLSNITSGSQVSCGCQRKKQFKLNWEGFATKLGDTTVKAIFKAFARKPHRWQQIAKRFGVAKAMVGACYRYWMKKLAAMTHAAKSEELETISNFEQCCLDRQGHKYGAWSSPTGIQLNDEDITDPHMRDMFGLAPAFDSI